MNLPDYHVLPAPLWLIATLHVVTLALHFLAMNFVFGGIVVLLLGKTAGKWQNPSVQRYVELLPVAMAATVTLGVAPLLFLQLAYSHPVYSAAIASAWPLMLVVAAVIAGYYLLYGAAFARGAGARRVPALLALALVAVAYVSLVYSSVFSMAERPEVYARLHASAPGGWGVHVDLGAWGLRWLHMVTGAIAVGGFFVGVVARGDDAVPGIGRRFFLWGMIATMLVGVLYLISLGDHVSALMRSPAICILLASIVASLGAMHLFFKGRLAWSGGLIGLSIAGMVAVRHALRLMMLDGSFDPASVTVRPQWRVFAIFLACFVVAIAAVWYMLTLYVRATHAPSGE